MVALPFGSRAAAALNPGSMARACQTLRLLFVLSFEPMMLTNVDRQG
jgi:hypothetical protein